jgi:hypothetical protein
LIFLCNSPFDSFEFLSTHGLLFNSDNTPLIWAAVRANVELCQLLISSKADVEAKDDRSLRRPFVAALRDIVLVSTQFYFDFSQRTALFWSVRNGQIDLCELLLTAGADIDAKNSRYAAPVPAALRCFNTLEPEKTRRSCTRRARATLGCAGF